MKKEGAQIFITGSANATGRPQNTGGMQLFAYEAEANMRCYNADTGQLVSRVPGKPTRGVQREWRSAAKQALDLVDRGGTVLWAAVYGKDVEIGVSPFQLYARELTITSTFVSPYSFPRALSLLPNLALEPLITDIVPLADIRRAFELHKGGRAIKILVQP